MDIDDKNFYDDENKENNNPNANLEDSQNNDILQLSENDQEVESAINDSSNTHLKRLISSNYIEYASYVIKERAIPEINDGLKPVQRRILWSLHRVDDGKFHKVANLVGYTMQFHPHGDASIYQSLVGLANKEYLIERQGNFGNILTGDSAAAARYIEARLTPLARETLFNEDVMQFVESYDGRNKEPIFLPAKIPLLLMTGQEGIAPGMTTLIMPHNFKELLEAQIAILNEEEFSIYPDFFQGGSIDVSDYNDGNGKVILRAKIEIDGRRLLIKEIPAVTDTERLIASIEKAVNKNKIKVSSINDYTAEKVEIEVIPARGYSPEKTLNALYAYTECEASISSSLLVIRENKPVIVSVKEVLKHNTESLLECLRSELIIEQNRLNEKFHEKSLERIFIENRIYKKIETCETYELVLSTVRGGLEKFISELKREITDADIEKLLSIPIRKISKYDLNKNKDDITDILALLKENEKNLRSIKKYTIKYIQSLIDRYAKNYPRKTEIENFEEIDKKAVALNNIKVGWDRGNGYIGSSVKSEECINCNEFDDLICIEKSGKYKVISISPKLYVGKLYYFNKYEKNTTFSLVYKEKSSGKYFVKRSAVRKFIRDKEYNLIPDGCQIEFIITREKCIYECVFEPTKRAKNLAVEIDFSKVQERAPGTRGLLLTDKKIQKFVFKNINDLIAINSDINTLNEEPAPLFENVDELDAFKDEEITESPKVKKRPSKRDENGKISPDNEELGSIQPDLGF